MHSFYYRVGPKFNYTDFADAVKHSLNPAAAISRQKRLSGCLFLPVRTALQSRSMGE